MTKRTTLLLLVSLGLALRLVLLPRVIADESLLIQNVDAQGYTSLAENLVTKRAFVGEAGQAETLRTPIYPMVLAACRLIGEDSLLLPFLIQVLLDLLIVKLLYQHVSALFDHRIAVLAALLKVFDVDAILSLYALMSETVFVLLFFAAYRLLVEPASRAESWRYLSAGALLGLAALTRPVGLYIGFLLVIGAVVVAWWRGASVRAPALAVASFALCTVPWMARNAHEYGPLVFSTSSGYNLLFENALYLQANAEHTSIEVLERSYKERYDVYAANPPAQAERMRHESISIIAAHPFAFIKGCLLATVGRMLAPNRQEIGTIVQGRWVSSGAPERLYRDGLTEAIRHYAARPGGQVGLLILPYLAMLWAAYGIGLMTSWRDPRSLLNFTIVAYFLSIPLMLLIGRLRLPAMPFVYVYAAVGMHALIAKWQQLRFHSLPPVCLTSPDEIDRRIPALGTRAFLRASSLASPLAPPRSHHMLPFANKRP